MTSERILYNPVIRGAYLQYAPIDKDLTDKYEEPWYYRYRKRNYYEGGDAWQIITDCISKQEKMYSKKDIINDITQGLSRKKDFIGYIFSCHNLEDILFVLKNTQITKTSYDTLKDKVRAAGFRYNPRLEHDYYYHQQYFLLLLMNDYRIAQKSTQIVQCMIDFYNSSDDNVATFRGKIEEILRDASWEVKSKIFKECLFYFYTIYIKTHEDINNPLTKKLMAVYTYLYKYLKGSEMGVLPDYPMLDKM